MFILQTLREFVDNPMGKGSNAIPSRQLIKDDLNRRFDKMLKEKGKKVDLDIFKNGDEYYFHFKIPSESEHRKNTYDVVIQFLLDDHTKEARGDKNLNRYMTRFFSNSPSFTYTYAYSFNLYGIFIEGLSAKFDPITFQHPPVTRNPAEIISFEKTIYFASIYLLRESKYLNKSFVDSIARPFKEAEFVKKIRNTDKIKLEIQQEDRRIAEEKKEADRKEASKPSTRRDETKIRGTKATTASTQKKIAPKSKITPRGTSKSKIRPK